MPICGWTSHKLQVNSDPYTKTKSFSTPDTKQINFDPQTEIKSSSTPHTETKSTSTTQTETKLISMLTLKTSDLRTAPKNPVNFDHTHFFLQKNWLGKSARAWVCSIRWKSTSSVNAEPMGDKNECTYRGGEGKTPVTMACPEDHWECKSSNHVSWKVKVMLKKRHVNYGPCFFACYANQYMFLW